MPGRGERTSSGDLVDFTDDVPSLAVEDDVIRARLASNLGLFFGRRRANHRRSKPFRAVHREIESRQSRDLYIRKETVPRDERGCMGGDSQLNEQESEAARSSMDEDKLPLLDLVRLFHKRQRRQPLHEHRRRIARREPVEQFHRLGRVGQGVLGETAPRRVGRDFVADSETVGGFVDAFTDGDDFSCALVSEDVRQRDFVNSAALVAVRAFSFGFQLSGHRGTTSRRVGLTCR